MNATRLYLGAALLLSVGTLAARFAQPTPVATPAPTPRTSESGTVELTVLPAHRLLPPGAGEFDVAVKVKAKATLEQPTQPVAMALVVDTSGSMGTDKMEQARQAARRLVQLTSERDLLAVVRFATDATSTPLRRMDAEGKAEALRFIDGLVAGGGTNIELALQYGSDALTEARGVRRLVLISDGEPTVGATDDGTLLARAATAHARGLAVTALGVGHDFRTSLMQGLVRTGGGFYGYLEDVARMEEVLAAELGQARGTLGRTVSLELALAPGVQVAQVPGRVVHAPSRDRAVITLPDLGPGSEATVFVHLTVPDTNARVAQVLTARLEWATNDGAVERLSQELALGVANDEDGYLASRDAALYADCVRALGATKVMAAAQAYERGDTATALSLLDSARGIFGMSADALAGETETLNRAQHQFRTVSDEGSRKVWSKGAELKGMKNFGENNSY